MSFFDLQNEITWSLSIRSLSGLVTGLTGPQKWTNLAILQSYRLCLYVCFRFYQPLFPILGIRVDCFAITPDFTTLDIHWLLLM